MKLSLLPLLAIAALGLGSCTKDKCGDMNIAVFALHNGETLTNYTTHPDTVFIKFNRVTSPGTNPSDFDTYYVGEAGEDHIHVENLDCGNYFIYRTAFDSVANKTYTGSTYINVPERAPDQDIFINVN